MKSKMHFLWIVLVFQGTACQDAPSLCDSEGPSNCLFNRIDAQFESFNRDMDSRLQCPEQAVTECGECPFPTSDSLSENLPQNCMDIYNLGYKESGIYAIYEPIFIYQRDTRWRSFERRIFNVYCDLDISNGGPGWIVIQRRIDGSVSFSKEWDDYKHGFGDLTGELWFGNDNLAIITQDSMDYKLRIDLTDHDNEKRFAEYSRFKVHHEDLYYKLELGTYSGDAGDSLASSNSSFFSTPARDHDSQANVNCASLYNEAGFWYSDCGGAYLNNPYRNEADVDGYRGISWQAWRGLRYSLKAVEMKLKPA